MAAQAEIVGRSSWAVGDRDRAAGSITVEPNGASGKVTLLATSTDGVSVWVELDQLGLAELRAALAE